MAAKRTPEAGKDTNFNFDSAAKVIAGYVASCHSDDRHRLYTAVAEELKGRSQGWSARLFEWISDKDRNG